MGFYARVLFPRFTWKAYNKMQFLLTKNRTESYIHRCLSSHAPLFPIIVSIETINRCNGKCSFCSANVKDEARPFKLMDEKLFDKILSELGEINYSDIFTLFINNEPFLDKRMPDLLKEARRRLPNAKIVMLTNGSALTAEKLNAIADSVDKLLINNYNDSYELTESSKMICEHVNKNIEIFKGIDVTIERRYTKETLSSRAGTSPNYTQKQNVIHYPCIMPFTDLTVFPDGVVGICCNDAHEKTNFGNLNDQSITDILLDKKMTRLRNAVARDRSNYDFCKYCDFADAGTRINYIYNRQIHPKHRQRK